jgi:hypothetical protein
VGFSRIADNGPSRSVCSSNLTAERITAQEMVSRMPRKYKPLEESFGKARGKEEW